MSIEKNLGDHADRRFAVLEHRTEDGVHWDLMLETDPKALLTTWSFEPPCLPPCLPLCLPIESFSVLAKRLPDHRRIYLDYEGPISGDRGTVRQIDSGQYEITGENVLRLFGKIFCGILNLSVSPSDVGKHVLTFSTITL